MSRVTLTFDNGPEPGVTDLVLDALRNAGMSATFFVIGQKVATAEGRRIVSRARSDGHRIGNHTYSHSEPLGLAKDPTLPLKEIGETQELLGDLAPERFFRANGRGGLGPHLLSVAAVAFLITGGYTCVTWNVVPRDWEDPDGWVERAISECHVRDWSVVVLHDLPTGAMKSLPRFLGRLRDNGTAIRNEFPDSCLPILRGRLMPPLKGLVAAEPAESDPMTQKSHVERTEDVYTTKLQPVTRPPIVRCAGCARAIK